jgi:hypothetical protein
LPVFFIERPPVRASGFHDAERRDELVRDAMQAALNGSAQIVAANAIAAALRQARVPSNLTFTSTPCLFIEKRLDGRSAYFLHNQKDEPVKVSFLSRATGHPARWDAATGERSGLVARPRDGQTEVTVDIAAGGAALVVFDDARLPVPARWQPADTIDLGTRQWTLDVAGHGQHGRVVRQQMTLDRLQDWRQIDGMADFSGQVTYRVDVTLSENWLTPGSKVYIDLGSVHDMAVVTARGKRQLTLIAPPFEADITAMLRPGTNRLQIGVYNSPTNAMIDPKKPGLKNLKPQPAGLIGPVRLVRKRQVPAT